MSDIIERNRRDRYVPDLTAFWSTFQKVAEYFEQLHSDTEQRLNQLEEAFERLCKHLKLRADTIDALWKEGSP